ncbi:MAG: hypothetical protein IPJ77_00745 [Planctomycetes bacterium]|nr:hypothetical protein [Planctomycetota bacterium]
MPTPSRFAFLLTALLAFLPLSRAAGGVDDARQIHWQRSLADALAIAAVEDRPLLVAVNMDGESACERIVREEYRDPRFVASTRAFVCVVASPVRHTARDHDDQGRRIPCPRLGEVTCGEHVALEPILYDAYLKDADRVAPRHALVLQDGKKAFDEFLLFDLRDLDAMVEEAARRENDRRTKTKLALATEPPAKLDPSSSASWRAWVAVRSARGRAAVEAALAAKSGERFVRLALEAIAAQGDAGALDALRVVASRASGRVEPVRAPLLAAVRATKCEKAFAEAARENVRGLGAFPGAADALDAQGWTSQLAELDGVSSATRTLLLGCATLGQYGADARRALERVFDAAQRGAIDRALDAQGGACSLDELLGLARRVRSPKPIAGSSPAPEPLPRAGFVSDALPEAAELERTLAELERELKEKGEAPELCARYAKAALDLGRRRIEANQPGAQFLLEDAEHFFDVALKARPGSATWWIERARTAYFLGKFERQAEFGRRACAASADGKALPGGLDPFGARTTKPQGSVESALAAVLLDDALAIEALRWIGDANARLLAERSGQDAGVEVAGLVEGARALGLVAVSPFGTPSDWVTWSSFYGAVGMWREELAVLQVGALRHPAAQELRQRLTASLWNGGRIDLAPYKAEWIADAHPVSADAAWFAGYAWVLGGEDARRVEDFERALAAYGKARIWFERSIELNAGYADSARHYVAMAWLGEGFARVVDPEGREGAARCLVEAVRARPGIAGVRDGLDREAVDLVDALVEWRASRASRVDARGVVHELKAIDPAGVGWELAFSDALLREALRADGRNPERVMKDTVDAADRPIRMMMGLATVEGDGLLAGALELAREARGGRDDEETRHQVAQCATIEAERGLERGWVERAWERLTEAAPLVGVEVRGGEKTVARAEEWAKELRGRLGPARPRNRAGR